MKVKKEIDLPFQEGKTYKTKFQTGELFLLNKIVYKKKSKIEDPDVIVYFEGVYNNYKHLGNCPLNIDRLCPEKEIIEEEIEICNECGKQK